MRAPAAPSLATPMVCGGCGARAGDQDPFPIRCPAARPGDDIDHVMVRRLDPARLAWPADDPEPNPFLRYRRLFRGWHLARAAGWPDERYVALVERLDAAVASVDGRGFRVTPLRAWPALGAAAGLEPPGGAWVKDETRNVAGSHKARHLMGLAIELEVAEAAGGEALRGRPLAIASCGNAALAAAVVARAAGRRLDVFVLAGADPLVLERLDDLGARTTVCPRDDAPGDPSVRAMAAAVAAGAIPFTCQGDQNGLAIEGGETLAWEIVDQLRERAGELDALVVQVGGGALASAVAAGLLGARQLGALEHVPRLVTVQAEGGWPLVRAWEQVVGRARAELRWVGEPLDPEAPAVRAFLDSVARQRGASMWPWETEPRSIAHGILDDECYDWLAVVRGMLATGGRAVVVDEPTLERANRLAIEATGVAVDHTGSAGLAGLLALARAGGVTSDERVGVLFTGARRDRGPDAASGAGREGRS